MTKTSKPGLVLTAGGSRGAYQAGVLKRVAELPSVRKNPFPFPIISGASAGAINGTALAAGAEDFLQAARFLERTWGNLSTEKVIKVDLKSLGQGLGVWMKDLAFGGFIGGGQAQSLLDATPLRKTLTDAIPVERIQGCLDRGKIYSLAISATDYLSGKSFTFIQGQKGHPTWMKSRRVALPSTITIEHVLASSAIPLVFQPVQLETQLGSFYFGDGALRLTAPLSPAIRLGADKLFAIGVRSQKAAEERARADLMKTPTDALPNMRKPPLAQIIGVILNSIFLDHLDADVEHLKRMNDLIETLSGSSEQVNGMKEPVRPIETLVVTPSMDLARVAEAHSSKMPAKIRYFMECLGSSKSESMDLMSYLLFEGDFTKAMVELGYKDASERIDEIEEFLFGKQASAKPKTAEVATAV